MTTTIKELQSGLDVALEPLSRSDKTADDFTAEEEPDEGRIEELRHLGLRPADARHIERLERTLDLPAEEHELERAKAAAVMRANLEARKKMIAQTVADVRDKKIAPYAAMKRLQALEIADADYNFARFEWGRGQPRLILYLPDGSPGAEYKLRDDQWFFKPLIMTHKNDHSRRYLRMKYRTLPT